MGKTHRRAASDSREVQLAPCPPKYWRDAPDLDTTAPAQRYKYTPDTQHKIGVLEVGAVPRIKKHRCTHHLPDPIEPLTDVLLQYDCRLCHQHFIDTQQMNERYVEEQRVKEETTHALVLKSRINHTPDVSATT